MSQFDNFPKDLDLIFDPVTGEAYISHTDIHDVVIWEPTGFTYFVDNYIEGPGVKQKAGICGFATEDTAGKMVNFVKKVTGFKSKVVGTNWDVYKVVDVLGRPVPQFQIEITKDDGETQTFNAGLLARSVIINENSAVLNLKSELGLS